MRLHNALAELLRDYGHDVTAVHDGPSAMEQAAVHRPDIVLLDIGMPGFDGYEVARRMPSELGLKASSSRSHGMLTLPN